MRFQRVVRQVSSSCTYFFFSRQQEIRLVTPNPYKVMMMIIITTIYWRVSSAMFHLACLYLWRISGMTLNRVRRKNGWFQLCSDGITLAFFAVLNLHWPTLHWCQHYIDINLELAHFALVNLVLVLNFTLVSFLQWINLHWQKVHQW